MTDEPTRELLSRLLDDDLDGVDRHRLEQRLATDPELKAELDSLRRIQESVAALADRMEPPERLTAVVKALRLGPPYEADRRRRLVRWLAAAAVAMLGVTVAVELVRRGDRPRSRLPTSIAAEDREMFQLKPLPTSGVPDEEAPLGAADRLVARQLPEPAADEPEPLEIIGPLTEAPAAATPEGSGERSRTATLIVTRGGQVVSTQVSLLDELPVGSHRLWVVLGAGRVVEVTPVSADGSLPSGIRSALVGVELAGITDGRHQCELRVTEPGRPSPEPARVPSSS